MEEESNLTMREQYCLDNMVNFERDHNIFMDVNGWFTGRKHTKESKRKLSKIFSGNGNPMWEMSEEKSQRWEKMHKRGKKTKVRNVFG